MRGLCANLYGPLNIQLQAELGRNVNLKLTLLLVASTLADCLPANGQSYSSSVLYPLTVPAGLVFNSAVVYPSQTIGSVTGTGNNQSSFIATLWTTAGGVNLNPTTLPPITNSIAYATNGSQQVGVGMQSNASFEHALLWTGTAASAIDLNPTNLSGVRASYALGISGTQEVGEGIGLGTGNFTHALLWSGTAGSAVDLNPTSLNAISNSVAYATNGSQQVGSGETDNGIGPIHALLWSNTAASAVDLQPTNLSGILGSVAYGISGNQQVGDGSFNNGCAY